APPRPVAVADEAAPVAAETPAPAEEDDEEPLLDAPYITSALCTSCNDCLQLDGAVFRYNADKQAILAAPERAPFAVLVKAAEACPSGCIHPGRPRSDDPTVTPELVARAQALGR
ncbi:MAG: ferredoxin, partial [Deltaproteobacteria bacterium]